MVRVMITTQCKDISTHDDIVREFNHKLGTNEIGANGGHGHYWTHAKDVYTLSDANEYLCSFIEKPLGSDQWIRYGKNYVGIEIQY